MSFMLCLSAYYQRMKAASALHEIRTKPAGDFVNGLALIQISGKSLKFWYLAASLARRKAPFSPLKPL
jgi:hypothetical protein